MACLYIVAVLNKVNWQRMGVDMIVCALSFISERDFPTVARNGGGAGVNDLVGP